MEGGDALSVGGAPREAGRGARRYEALWGQGTQRHRSEEFPLLKQICSVRGAWRSRVPRGEEGGGDAGRAALGWRDPHTARCQEGTRSLPNSDQHFFRIMLETEFKKARNKVFPFFISRARECVGVSG